jgi:hypothetical protein
MDLPDQSQTCPKISEQKKKINSYYLVNQSAEIYQLVNRTSQANRLIKIHQLID